MGNFFGNVGDQAIETLHLMGNGGIYAFFIVGICFLTGSLLINWQIRRIERIVARGKAEDADAPGAGTSGRGTGEPPRG